MEEEEKYWHKIQDYIRSHFGMKGEVYDIAYLIGVRELGYGFEPLDQDTKTKVYNFVAIYLMNFMDEEQRREIRKKYGDQPDMEEQIYRKAIIHYFRSKQIL